MKYRYLLFSVFCGFFFNGNAFAQSPLRCESIFGIVGNQEQALALTDDDKKFLKSSTIVTEVSDDLVKRFENMSPSERRAYSIDYLNPVVKRFIEIAEELDKKFDPKKIANDFPETSPYLSRLEALSSYLKNARSEGFGLITNKALTIENVVSFIIRIEKIRKIYTFTTDSVFLQNRSSFVKYNAPLENYLLAQVLREGDNQLSYFLNILVKHLEAGGVWIPTFAETNVDFFAERWPRVRPIALSAKPIVAFDGLPHALSALFTLHDIGGHNPFNNPTPEKFRLFDEIKKHFYNNTKSEHPDLFEFAKMFFLVIGHETEWPKKLEAYIDDKSSLTIENLAKIENFILNGNSPQAIENFYLMPPGFRPMLPALFPNSSDVNSDVKHSVQTLLPLLLKALEQTNW